MTSQEIENIEKISESKLAYKILTQLSDKERPAEDRINASKSKKAKWKQEYRKTPTELASNLGTSSQSINNYLKILTKLNLVEKCEKEGRSQPYKIKTNPAFSTIFWHYWEKKIRENTEFNSYKEYRNSNFSTTSKGIDLPKKSSFENELNQVLCSYIRRLSNLGIDYTIKEVFTDIFSRQAKFVLSESGKENMAEWVNALMNMITVAESKDLGSYEVLYKSFMENQKQNM